MTPTEVKEAHDELWAVVEKIGIKQIREMNYVLDEWKLLVYFPIKGNRRHCKAFYDKAEVNQFLKEQ